MTAPFENADRIEAKDTGRYGRSLFAKRDFKKDEVVFVAFGAIVKEATPYTVPIVEMGTGTFSDSHTCNT